LDISQAFVSELWGILELLGSRDAGYSSLDTLPVILFHLLNLARRISRDHEPLNAGLTTSMSLSIWVSRTAHTTQTSWRLHQNQDKPEHFKLERALRKICKCEE
jgi:hypothetical protein